MNSDNQHPRDPSRPKRQSRMSREIVSSNNSMLVTPTLEWQDRLSSTYARINKFEMSSSSISSPPLHVGGQPSLQRRRLDKEIPVSSDRSRLYRLDPVSESDDSDDAANMIGELSLDENKEVRLDVTNVRRSSAVSITIGAVSWPHQRSSPFISSRPHG